MCWAFIWSNSFKKQYKKKEKTKQVAIKEKLKELATSKNPLSLGEKKKNLNFYALDLNYSDRIAYGIESSEPKVIKLIKVCSHKTVYGKD